MNALSNTTQIISDEKSLAMKEVALRNMRNQTFLNSVSKVATFIGGPLFATGLGMAAPVVFAHGLAGAAVGVAALSTAAPIAVGILAAGALFVAAAVVTDFVSSRIYQGCQFDNTEFNAESTARHLVKEIKANNMCMAHEQDFPCEKEKNWAKFVDGQRAQIQVTSTGR